MAKIIKKFIFTVLVFSITFVSIVFCETNGKIEDGDYVYLESDIQNMHFTEDFGDDIVPVIESMTGPNKAGNWSSVRLIPSVFNSVGYKIIEEGEKFYKLKFCAYYRANSSPHSSSGWPYFTSQLIDKTVGDIVPSDFVVVGVQPTKNGLPVGKHIEYNPTIDFKVVSINPESSNSSSNNNKSTDSSNNSSTNTSSSGNASSNTNKSNNTSNNNNNKYKDNYNFPEDEFTGPGVDTAQNNNSISNTSTNEMTINGTPTNSYSVSQSNSATYDTNNTYNAGNNVQGLPVVKAGDIVRCRMVAYKDGELYVDKLYEGEISTDELIKTFAGHYLGETFTQKFEGTSNVAYYTILLINGVSEEDFRQQQASQALAQSIQAASSQKAINDYTKADTPLVGVNNASQNDDSAILLPSNKSELKDDNHFYLDNSLQKDTWVYDTVYYYYVDKNGDIEKNKWIDNRFVGEDGRMYRSRQTPDGLWVNDKGIVIDINLDLYNSTIEKEVTPDSWYCTNAGLWYYFENDRTTTKKGWFTDSSDNQTYYLDPITGIMQVGWVSIDGKYYYFNDQHENEVNWKETGGGFYESLGKKVKAYGSMFKNEETPDGYYVNKNGEYTEKKNTNATRKISWVFVILVILLILIIIIIIFRRLKTKFNKEHSAKFERRDK